jgi:hypothetical protein
MISVPGMLGAIAKNFSLITLALENILTNLSGETMLPRQNERLHFMCD